EEFLRRKRNNAALYKKLLQNIPWIALPQEKEHVKSSCWMFYILLQGGRSRDSVAKKLKKHGIDSRVIFYPISDMPPYKKFDRGRLEVSKKIAYTGLSLPSSTQLKEKDIAYICK